MARHAAGVRSCSPARRRPRGGRAPDRRHRLDARRDRRRRSTRALVRDPRHAAGALAMMAHWDLRPLAHDLARLRTPLAMLVGADDRAVPPAQARRVRRLLPAGLACSVSVLPRAGHLVHEERADEVAGRVLEAGAPRPSDVQSPSGPGATQRFAADPARRDLGHAAAAPPVERVMRRGGRERVVDPLRHVLVVDEGRAFAQQRQRLHVPRVQPHLAVGRVGRRAEHAPERQRRRWRGVRLTQNPVVDSVHGAALVERRVFGSRLKRI